MCTRIEYKKMYHKNNIVCDRDDALKSRLSSSKARCAHNTYCCTKLSVK